MPPDAGSSAIDTDCGFAPTWVMPPTLRELIACGDGELVEELLAIFQTDTASRLEIVRLAVAAADYATVRGEAHTIRGSAMQVGANLLAGLCGQIEQEAQKNPLVDLARPLSRLFRSFHEVCGVIAARGKSAGEAEPPAMARDGSHTYGE